MRKNLTVYWALVKTFFFRLKLIGVAFTASIHELQAVAEFVIEVPSHNELSARPCFSPLSAYICQSTTATVSPISPLSTSVTHSLFHSRLKTHVIFPTINSRPSAGLPPQTVIRTVSSQQLVYCF